MSHTPLLMTRPGGANASFVQLIRAEVRAQLHIIESPLTRIEQLSSSVELPPGAQVIFTSQNGVKFAPQGNGRLAYCVGERTTRVAAQAGWAAVCAGQNANELVADVMARAPQAALVHLCGMHVRGDIAERLTAAGHQTTRICLYDQLLVPLSVQAVSVLEDDSRVIVPLFSPRAAAHFAAVCPVHAQVLVAALSPSVAESLGNLPILALETAPEPTAGVLALCIEKLLLCRSLG
ncbi:MAG: uroporphyrinogen-III synthase [Roseobacter sp.]